ncbi:MAG: hypothetical protein JXQ87_16945 [Bacteroidia bacterium]
MKFNRHNLLIVAIIFEMLFWAILFFLFIKNQVLTNGFQEEIIYFLLIGLLGVCSLIAKLRYIEFNRLLVKNRDAENLLDSEIVGSVETVKIRVPFLLKVGNGIYGFLNVVFAIIMLSFFIYSVFDNSEPFHWSKISLLFIILLSAFVGPMTLYNMTSTNYKYG